MASPILADDFIDTLNESASAEIEKSETDALQKQADLSKKYIAALKGLEEKFKSAGDLDAIIRVRAEADSIAKSGEVTSHADKSITELREKYLAARKGILTDANAARQKVVETLTKAIREKEAALTKGGQVEQALALRKAGEELLLELSAGMASDNVEFGDDPRADQDLEAKELVLVEVPGDSPPLFEKPFSIKGQWIESMTLPVLKQRVSETISIGNQKEGKRPTVVIPKGSVWSGKEATVMVSAGKLIATKSSFQDLRFLGDLASTQYYSNCLFQDCGFSKGGNRIGGEQAAKIYFGNCVVTGGLAKKWNIRHTGYRGQGSVFEKIDLPEVSFEGRDPARYLNHPWVKFANCRFVNCKVPASFAAITRDCIFENCEFIDDPKFEGGTRPFEVVLYLTSNSRWNVSKAPATLTFTRKPDTERKGDPIPKAQALKDMMGF